MPKMKSIGQYGLPLLNNLGLKTTIPVSACGQIKLPISGLDRLGRPSVLTIGLF